MNAILTELIKTCSSKSESRLNCMRTELEGVIAAHDQKSDIEGLSRVLHRDLHKHVVSGGVNSRKILMALGVVALVGALVLYQAKMRSRPRWSSQTRCGQSAWALTNAELSKQTRTVNWAFGDSGFKNAMTLIWRSHLDYVDGRSKQTMDALNNSILAINNYNTAKYSDSIASLLDEIHSQLNTSADLPLGRGIMHIERINPHRKPPPSSGLHAVHFLNEADLDTYGTWVESVDHAISNIKPHMSPAKIMDLTEFTEPSHPHTASVTSAKLNHIKVLIQIHLNKRLTKLVLSNCTEDIGHKQLLEREATLAEHITLALARLMGFIQSSIEDWPILAD